MAGGGGEEVGDSPFEFCSAGAAAFDQFIRFGMQIDKNVEREIINHRMLSGHPNIVRFREVRKRRADAVPRTLLGC